MAIDGLREQIALSECAAESQELVKLRSGFDTLGNATNAQFVCDAHHPFNDNHAGVTRDQPLDKRPVDLDDVDGYSEEVRQ